MSICIPGLRKMETRATMQGTPEMEVGTCTETQEEVHVRITTPESHTTRSNNNTKPNRAGTSSPTVTAVTRPNKSKTHTIIVLQKPLRKELWAENNNQDRQPQTMPCGLLITPILKAELLQNPDSSLRWTITNKCRSLVTIAARLKEFEESSIAANVVHTS